MSKWEKVAWIEIGVTALATLLVYGAYPWHGIQAIKLYALLGVVVLAYPFIAWQRGQEIVRDERDYLIERRSKAAGTAIAWVFLFVSLGSLSMLYDPGGVPAVYLHSLVWIQFAIYIGVTALVTVVGYKKTGYAA